MIKAWYLHVKDETMAPARMVSFMEQHAATCDICLKDPDLKDEIAKITELILPESKIPKAVRQQNNTDDEEEYEEDESDKNDDDLNEDEEENEEDLDDEMEDEFLDEDEDED